MLGDLGWTVPEWFTVIWESGEAGVWVTDGSVTGGPLVGLADGGSAVLLGVPMVGGIAAGGRVRIEAGRWGIGRIGQEWPGRVEVASSARVLWIGYRCGYLHSLFERSPGAEEWLRGWVEGEAPSRLVVELVPTDAAGVIELMASPAVGVLGRDLWFRAKVMEVLAWLAWRAAPAGGAGLPFCSLQKRLAMERVRIAKGWLAVRLDEPLDLAGAAKAAACSPAYLSRTFRHVTGATMKRWHRHKRVEWAARLLAEGRHNISEAAVEVGYRSFSQFTRAFTAELGCGPREWLAKRSR